VAFLGAGHLVSSLWRPTTIIEPYGNCRSLCETLARLQGPPPVAVQVGFVLCATALLLFVGVRATAGAQRGVEGRRVAETSCQRNHSECGTRRSQLAAIRYHPTVGLLTHRVDTGLSPAPRTSAPRLAPLNPTSVAQASAPPGAGSQSVRIPVEDEVRAIYRETDIPDVTVDRLIPPNWAGTMSRRTSGPDWMGQPTTRRSSPSYVKKYAPGDSH
jgi:hypothetical protein